MRDDGDEAAGMMNARRCGGGGGAEQSVTVYARGVEVRIALSEGSYPAGLTAAQARFLARKLNYMARLVEQRGAQAATARRLEQTA